MKSGSPSFGTPESAIGLLCTGPDRAPLRAAVPLRRRAERVEPDGRRAGRLRVADDDAADVPRRHELRHALGRLARGRPRVELREVHHRHRAPADAQARVQAARGHARRPRLRRARGGRLTAATSSAPRTRCCTSATASTGRCCRRPDNFDRWTKNGGQDAADARRRDLAQTLDAYEQPADRRRRARRAARLRGPAADRAGRRADRRRRRSRPRGAGAPRLPLAHARPAGRPTTWSSSAAAGTGWRPPTTSRREHGITDVAVLERGWLGGGNMGRNTTIIRSNYLWDESAAIYEHSLKLWEGLAEELDYDLLFSQRGVLNLAHNLGDVREGVRRVTPTGSTASTPSGSTPTASRSSARSSTRRPTLRYPVLGATLQRARRHRASTTTSRGRFAPRRRRARRRPDPGLRGDGHRRSTAGASPASRRRAGRSAAGRVALAAAGPLVGARGDGRAAAADAEPPAAGAGVASCSSRSSTAS